MPLMEIAIFGSLFLVALLHHGKKCYRTGREEGTNEGIELSLKVLQKKGIITYTEAEEILRNE